MFLSLLEYNSKVVIVGEPTGQGPFFCGVPRTVALPNSGMELLVASQYNRCALINDSKNQIMPDIPVPYTAEDFLCDRDSAMEAVLNYRPAEPKFDLSGSEEAENLAGKYGYSPFQVLTVKKEGKILRFSVSDFIEDSYRNASSDLYPAGNGRFLTDIEGVELQFVSGPGEGLEGMPGDPEGARSEKCGGGVILIWRGVESYAPKVQPDYVLPMELIAEGNIEEGASAIIAHKDLYIAEMPDLERRLNRMGYDLLNRDDFQPAVKIFKLNADLFPASSNTYDSLGEAYLHSGDIRQAEENYRKSLELNPGNDNARKIIVHIENGRRFDRSSGKWKG
ncbi:MAG: tetratricopeptide repeat protein [Candidatus Krumholzibacteriota bacterium]|nr:tetratricopeptide repeat protein [Candidatus Krumholzibacteriota bacterium]